MQNTHSLIELTGYKSDDSQPMVQPPHTEPDIELCKAGIMLCYKAQHEPYAHERILLTEDCIKDIPLPSSFSKIWRLLSPLLPHLTTFRCPACRPPSQHERRKEHFNIFMPCLYHHLWLTMNRFATLQKLK